jgi:hypothetical protein
MLSFCIYVVAVFLGIVPDKDIGLVNVIFMKSKCSVGEKWVRG